MSNQQNPFSWLTENGDPEGEVNEILEQQREHALKFANLVNSVLGEGDGLEIMERLRDFTIEKPLYQVTGSIVTGEVTLSPSEWAAVREGQNSVIRFLEGQIRLARNPDIAEGA